MDQLTKKSKDLLREKGSSPSPWPGDLVLWELDRVNRQKAQNYEKGKWSCWPELILGTQGSQGTAGWAVYALWISMCCELKELSLW